MARANSPGGQSGRSNSSSRLRAQELGRSISAPNVRSATSSFSLPPGPHALGSIPGYTGYVAGRAAENIHGHTHAEAGLRAHAECTRRFLPPQPSTRTAKPSGSIDSGSLNSHLGHSRGNDAPTLTVMSGFHNPKGHGHRRGAAIPGYCGHIPGRYAGNVYGDTVARANVSATDIRKKEFYDPVHVSHKREVNWEPASFKTGGWSFDPGISVTAGLTVKHLPKQGPQSHVPVHWAANNASPSWSLRDSREFAETLQY